MELSELVDELTAIYNNGLEPEMHISMTALRYGSFAYQSLKPDKTRSVLNQIDTRQWAEKLYKPNK